MMTMLIASYGLVQVVSLLSLVMLGTVTIAVGQTQSTTDPWMDINQSEGPTTAASSASTLGQLDRNDTESSTVSRPTTVIVTVIPTSAVNDSDFLSQSNSTNHNYSDVPATGKVDPTSTTSSGNNGTPALQTTTTLPQTTSAGDVTTSPGNNGMPALQTTTSLPQTTSPGDNVTRRTTCFPGFHCLHGYCLNELSCECDTGWTGLFCQLPCPDDCGPDAECGASSSGNAVCLCLDRTIPFSPITQCSTANDTTTAIIESSPPTTENLTRSEADRECFPGFRCVHGYCQFGLTRCVCDEGWVGHFCHEPCTLDCHNGGVCAQNEEGDRYCDCMAEFTGPACDQLKTSNGLSNTTEPDIGPATDSVTAMTTEIQTAVNQTTSMDTLNETDQEEPTPETMNRECAPGFSCVHGVCVVGNLECKCEPGWEGLFCQTQTNPTDNPNSTHSTPTVTDPNTKIEFWDWEPLSGYGNLSNYSLRNCSLGFTCRYGNCSNETKPKCDCEPGFTGTFCHKSCPLDCGEQGSCKLNSPNTTVETPHCECTYPYYGDNCTLIRPLKEKYEESSSHWYAIGVALALVVVLVMLLVVLPYALWRRRNITIMKIVFWLRSYEEDDGRDYDGFVAYASCDNDRKFVMNELIPNLEGRLSFSLCIHERDFMPGVYIATNINEAVRKSRRTLIIVSSDFVRRQWCQFEFEVAVREMVEQKHRILPIILGNINDIKQEMSDSLKHILSTVTYLEYPGTKAKETEIERFWKKIQLSMPKKQAKLSSVPSKTIDANNSSISHSKPSLKCNNSCHHLVTEHIDIDIDLSVIPTKSQSPSSRDIKEQNPSNGNLPTIVRIPASMVDEEEKINFLSHLWRKLRGQESHKSKSYRKKHPRTKNSYAVTSRSHEIPESFIHPNLQRNCTDSASRKIISHKSDSSTVPSKAVAVNSNIIDSRQTEKLSQNIKCGSNNRKGSYNVHYNKNGSNSNRAAHIYQMPHRF